MNTKWQSRIVELAYMPISEITPNPSNWRKHPTGQRGALKAVLEQVGVVMPVLYNKRTGRLIDGHLRQELARAESQEELPVIVVDVSEDDERLILATLDPIAAMATADDEMLASLIEKIEVDEGPLQDLLDEMGDDVPNFEPVGEDEQGRLDQKKPVVCPECGHEFTT